MLIDTHCHLDAGEFADDRDVQMLAARQAGVARIVVPAVCAGNFADVRACCARYPECSPAYGIHPLFVARASDDDLLTAHEWLAREASGPLPPVAVGEIGLDFFVPGFDAARQERFFVAQLQIAGELGLPVLLHVRRAVDQVLKCVRRSPVRRGVAHAFNGSAQQAGEFIALGFKLGFGGAMTYAGSTRIRRLAAELPLDAIVLETDAPDIPPAWLAGRRNAPRELLAIARVLADLRGIPLPAVIEATGRTASALLGVSA